MKRFELRRVLWSCGRKSSQTPRFLQIDLTLSHSYLTSGSAAHLSRTNRAAATWAKWLRRGWVPIGCLWCRLALSGFRTVRDGWLVGGSMVTADSPGAPFRAGRLFVVRGVVGGCCLGLFFMVSTPCHTLKFYMYM